MKRTIFGIGLFTLMSAFLAASTPAFSADRQRNQQRIQFGETAGSAQVQVFGAGELMDKPVKNTQGEDLGKISDVIFTRDGRVAYLLIGEGGVLGYGEKYFPSPFKSAQWNPQQNVLILPDVSKESLKSAPTVSRNDWGQLSDPIFERNVNTYYAQQQSVPKRTSP